MSQVIKKRDIVIASVLKPVDDTRMFEKMAMSFARSGKYTVHIIGFPSLQQSPHEDILFYPLPRFVRLNPVRLFIPLKVFFYAVRIRPEIMIVNTHELLGVGVCVKIFSFGRLLYDIRENYYRNILYLPTFPKWLRPLLAGYVRLKEKLLAPFVDQFILAEAGYRRELTFIQKRSLVIENKAIKNIVRPARSVLTRHKRLLFSGTLAASSGVFITIELAVQLHSIDPSIELHIIGYCAQPGTLRKIRKAIRDLPFISLTGGEHLVPHTEIAIAIASADFGIIAYPPNLSSINTTPTKLFEYLAAELPILMLEHPPWAQRCRPYRAAVFFEHPEKDPSALLERMSTHSFYTTSPGAEAFWETEARKLLELCENLLNS